MAKKTDISLVFIFAIYLFTFLFWLIYRYFTHFPDFIDEIIAKPIIWITPAISVLILKQGNLKSLGFKKISFRFLLISVITGILLTALQYIPIYLQTHKYPLIPSNLFILSIATVGTAIFEEILFRGFILKNLQDYLPGIMGNIITSILFCLIHIPILLFIQHITGIQLLVSLYVIFASSLIYGFLYQYTKNLWSPIITHYILDVLLLIF